MLKAEFYSVHKDFAQDGQNGTIWGHEEFFGLDSDAAKTTYHQLLASAYSANDPWTHVFIENDNGARIFSELIDRRTLPEPEEAGNE